MRLYVVFHCDLLGQLALSNHGACLSGIRLSCPSYADDIYMVALHKSSLQCMLAIAYKHSQLWRYEFNPLKSQVLIFGKDPSVGTELRLGGELLDVVKADTHLGVPLASDLRALEDILGSRISKGRRSFHASLALGSKYHPFLLPYCPSCTGR